MTTPRVPRAEETAQEIREKLEAQWVLLRGLDKPEAAGAVIQIACMKPLREYARAVLEAAAEVVEKRLSVDSGDPARWTDAIIVPIAAEIRALKEDR